MIRYALSCAGAHRFESWFYDSAAFDEQKERGLVACPICGSVEVSKTIMAPALIARARPQAADETPAVPVLSDEERRGLARALRAKVMAETRDVGRDFALEARRIHGADDAGERIRGQATVEEARGLLEDGILILPVPAAPDDLN